MNEPVEFLFPDTCAAALAVVAMQNEATALDALQRPDDAARLRVQADRLQKRTFAVRPVIYRPSLAEIRWESGL